MKLERNETAEESRCDLRNLRPVKRFVNNPSFVLFHYNHHQNQLSSTFLTFTTLCLPNSQEFERTPQMASSELPSIEKLDSRDEKRKNVVLEDRAGIEEEYPSSFRLLAVVIALVLSMFLASLDMTIIATAIPKITGMSTTM
jgi:hypothetical protein